MKRILLFSLLFFLLSGFVLSDCLPPAVPETQNYIIDTQLNVTGSVDLSSQSDWTVAGTSPIPTGKLEDSQVISFVRYQDVLMSNGGTLIGVKKWEYDADNQDRQSYNLEHQKLLSYHGKEGGFLSGDEHLLMDNAGNYSSSNAAVRCVFADPPVYIVPAFCNIVQAQSTLININTAQISQKAQVRSTGSSSTPAGLTYYLAVSPEFESGFAQGGIRTEFSGSIMEGRGTNVNESGSWNRTSAENTWMDVSEVTGDIKHLEKEFVYKSGLIL